MKSISRIAKSALFLAILILAVSCDDSGKDKVIKIDPEYGRYISGVTTGVLSIHSNVVIRFVNPVPQPSEIGTAVPPEFLVFRPHIPGTAIWKDAHTLEFIPEGKLEPGKRYTAKLALSKLMEVEKGFEDFRFQFQTMFQDVSLIRESMETRKQDLSLVDLKLLVHTSDVMDIDDLQKSIHVSMDGESYETVLTPLEERSILLTIHDLPRRDEQGTVHVEIEPQLLSLESKKSYEFTIPTLSEFELLDASVSEKSGNKVVVEFSDPLQEQDLRGLITLEDVDDLRFVQRNNTVEIHLQNAPIGDKLLTVHPGVANSAGRQFGKTQSRTISFKSYDPRVSIPNGKTILPDGDNGLIFAFDAVSLNAVDVYITKIFSDNVLQYFQDNDLGNGYYLHKLGRNIFRKHVELRTMGGKNLSKWNRFYIDLADILTPDKGAFYEVEIRYRREYAILPCTETEDSNDDPALSHLGSEGWISEDSYLNDDYYADYQYDWENQEDPCHPAYYSPYRTSSSKIVMSTRMGLLAKRGEDQMIHVAVNDIQTAAPMPGIAVEVFDFQQQSIAKGTTDVHGMVTLKCTRTPFVVSATSPGDKSYLKVQEGKALSLSNFEVQGASVKGGIKGFIYAERDVWRPGDSLYLNFILEDQASLLPESHPVQMKIFDPRDRLISTTVHTSPTGNFYDFRTATAAEAPTGRYRAEVSVGNRTFQKNLSIETVKPNRLKVELDFKEEVLKGQTIAGTLSAQWLHGAPAPNLEADVTMGLWTGTTTFDGYEDYSFDNAFRVVRDYSVNEIFEGTLDRQGNATFSVDMKDKTGSAPGMLKAFFEAKVYEPGGGFSIRNKTLTYSPYDRYAGIAIPEGSGWGGSLATGQKHAFKVVSLDVDGQPTKTQKLEVELYKIDWSWWYDRYNGTTLNYLNNTSVRKVKSETVQLDRGKGVWNITLSDGDWGRYLAVVTDPESGHSAAEFAYFDWPYQQRAQRGGPASTILELYSDKETYRSGDKATVSFLSPENGRALVSIENGTRVLKSFWMKTSAGKTEVEIDVEEGMAPNVYAHITILQPHDQTLNDRPMRMYGILPLIVDNPATRLEPVIDAPDVLRPGEKFTVEISERQGRPLTYTLAMVDDGLLDLTAFKTPDPHGHFYAPEALGVRTWDFYDEVLGALDVGRSEVLRIGGDEAGRGAGTQKARRFSPVVHHIGPITLDKNGTNKHEITMPNYVGSVRLMVVAAHERAYGNAELTRQVKSPLMVLAGLPRVIGPGETIELPVNVFSMEPDVKSADIRVNANDLFSLPDGNTATVKFDGETNKTVYFEMKVKETLGVGKIKVEAKSGNHRSSNEVEIQVRPPNPLYTKVKSHVIAPGETWEGEIEYFGIDGTNEARVELSDLPPINLEAKLNYLINYPHGCVEQIVSSAFTQLVTDQLVTLTAERKAQLEDNVRYTLKRLPAFQLGSGGLTYWPGSSRAHDWGTSYAGHFALLAESEGYQLPPGFKSRWFQYQRSAARNWLSSPDNTQGYSQRSQAYRLYTMALYGNAEMSGMNHLANVKDLDITARYILALAYAEAGLKSAAVNLIENRSRRIPEYTELSYTFGSHIRDDGFVLLALHAVDFKEDAAEVAQRLATTLGKSNHYGTQTTAFSIFALAKYLNGEQDSGIRASFTSGGRSQQIETAMPLVQLNPGSDPNQTTFSVTNQSEARLYGRLIVSGRPLAGAEQRMSNNLSVDVYYVDNNYDPVDVTRLPLGTDFIAVVFVRNPGTRGDLKNLALTQIFPSGWEILNPRLSIPNEGPTDIEYQDVRDDRVYSYFDMNESDILELNVRLNAAYPGRFYLPAVSCEAMYDGRVSAVVPGQWVEVYGSDK